MMHKVARDQNYGTSLGVHTPVPTDEEDVRQPNTGASFCHVLKLTLHVFD